MSDSDKVVTRIRAWPIAIRTNEAEHGGPNAWVTLRMRSELCSVMCDLPVTHKQAKELAGVLYDELELVVVCGRACEEPAQVLTTDCPPEAMLPTVGAVEEDEEGAKQATEELKHG